LGEFCTLFVAKTNPINKILESYAKPAVVALASHFLSVALGRLGRLGRFPLTAGESPARWQGAFALPGDNLIRWPFGFS
jgi:hypothetical protein